MAKEAEANHKRKSLKYQGIQPTVNKKTHNNEES